MHTSVIGGQNLTILEDYYMDNNRDRSTRYNTEYQNETVQPAKEELRVVIDKTSITLEDFKPQISFHIDVLRVKDDQILCSVCRGYKSFRLLATELEQA